MPEQLNPLNPFARVVKVQTLDPATGQKVPATSGTPPTGFFATSRAPDATVAGGQAALSVDGGYVGNQAGFQAGDWLLYFAPATLTIALLDPIFMPAGVKCYFIYTRPGAHRVVEELMYARSRMATVVP